MVKLVTFHRKGKMAMTVEMEFTNLQKSNKIGFLVQMADASSLNLLHLHLHSLHHTLQIALNTKTSQHTLPVVLTV